MSETVESLERVTRKLIHAAEAGDTGSLAGILEERGALVATLQRQLGEMTDDEQRKRLLTTINLQAGEADAVLNRLRGTLRDALLQLAGSNRAIHGYSTRSSDPSSLDRAG